MIYARRELRIPNSSLSLVLLSYENVLPISALSVIRVLVAKNAVPPIPVSESYQSQTLRTRHFQMRHSNKTIWALGLAACITAAHPFSTQQQRILTASCCLIVSKIRIHIYTYQLEVNSIGVSRALFLGFVIGELDYSKANIGVNNWWRLALLTKTEYQ